MIRKIGKTIAVTTAVGVATAASYDYLSDSYIFTRTLRALRCGLHIVYAYKVQFNENNFLQIHDSVAQDIYETCKKNDGLYVKLGQGMAAMDHLLPPPYYKHISKLQDKALAVPYDEISKMFQSQVGKKIEECFQEFTVEPVASASIAQVHQAILKNGQKVAVKIQKPNIKKQFKPDMTMHYVLLYALEKLFDMPLLHFEDDIQQNLKKQLDFRIEAENSKIADKNFKLLKRSEIHVPTVIDQFTRERVLVTEWIDGIKITDNQQLKKFGYNKKQIMNKLIRAFADQIFVTGFVHCDPHPGNVFVRPHPLNKKDFQVVILDHGLCLDLPNQFRKQYSQFWKAMFVRDTQKMKQVCRSWGITKVDEFAGFTIMKPYNSSKRINEKVERKDVMKMQAMMKEKMKQMMKQTQNLPKQLIFVGRNMNLVRSLNKYHGAVADRLTILARSAYIGAQTKNSNQPKTGMGYGWSTFVFNFNLLVVQATDWILKKFSGKNIEDHFEDKSFQQSQKMFAQYGFKPIDESTLSG